MWVGIGISAVIALQILNMGWLWAVNNRISAMDKRIAVDLATIKTQLETHIGDTNLHHTH